jgi:hypothetical protein
MVMSDSKWFSDKGVFAYKEGGKNGFSIGLRLWRLCFGFAKFPKGTELHYRGFHYRADLANQRLIGFNTQRTNADVMWRKSGGIAWPFQGR